MATRRSRQMTWLVSCMSVLVSMATHAQRQSTAPSSAMPRADQETFLLHASIIGERRSIGGSYAWRVSLDDGTRKHDAAVETEDGTTPTRRNYRLNVAAYELDTALQLHFVAPSVVRIMNGRPASVTWWVDDVAMSEQDRREKHVEAPDGERWNNQLQAVRVFDELIANAYRNLRPDHSPPTSAARPTPSYAWGELLITRDWSIWLIDHTATFQTRKQLAHTGSLNRCDRALLDKLRTLNREAFTQTLATYLSAEQLDALEVRRALLVRHFADQIAQRGEGAVLYDLPPRP